MERKTLDSKAIDELFLDGSLSSVASAGGKKSGSKGGGGGGGGSSSDSVRTRSASSGHTTSGTD